MKALCAFYNRYKVAVNASICTKSVSSHEHEHIRIHSDGESRTKATTALARSNLSLSRKDDDVDVRESAHTKGAREPQGAQKVTPRV